jgi:hypothetical protein
LLTVALANGSVPPKVQLVAPQPAALALAVKLGPNVMLLAKTEASLKPEATDAEVELTGKSQPIKRRLCAKELEHIPKEMIAQKREKILKLPTIKIILTKVSNFASG